MGFNTETCDLCGRGPLRTYHAVVCVPPFLRPDHPFARYTNDGFHAECFLAWPHWPKLEALLRLHNEVFEELEQLPPSEREARHDAAYAAFLQRVELELGIPSTGPAM